MKKIYLKILPGFVAILLLSQCNSSNDTVTPLNTHLQLTQLRKTAMFELLSQAKDQQFRDFVLNESLKQEHGDYNVYFSKIISVYKKKSGYEKFVSKLENISKNIKALNNGLEPMIFYPRAETIEVSIKRSGNTRTSRYDQEVIGVFEEPIYPIDTSPGFIVNLNNDLVFYENISEEFAWENDVWVVGEEENVSSENMVAALEDFNEARFQGQSEYGGIIQCTDLGAIEPWTSGKLEFKIFVLSSSGTQISVRAFGKWKRSNFRDQKWKDFGHFIGNWNTTTFGNWMIENWWEEDGGQSNSVTITVPPPAGQTGPTVSTTIPSQNRDDNLGIATIQFTDPITQVYNISYANIKRRN